MMMKNEACRDLVEECPGRGNNMYKAPKVGLSLLNLKNSMKANVA